MNIRETQNGLEASFRAPTIRKKVKGQELVEFLLSIRQSGVDVDQLMFVCIGTDRSTGDALGPLVGSMLEEAGYPHVQGTLQNPLDASNLLQRLENVRTVQPARKAQTAKTAKTAQAALTSRKVIAIDACLGQPSSVASYQVSNQPMEPGKSVGRALPLVGDYSIAAIVNINGGNQYALLQSTPLYRVMTMAKEIASAIITVFPLDKAPLEMEAKL
ncbi:spore protease YyaC [Paenibacillus agricola]|uniref:Spore protease YyaC n=1 Tax=Paenibacillus agricola TaxID=2716264 RepID=A0ABX0JH34_9BACL|nr:spore protease YyaC [Paenibacillus agricola]NHN33000.1 spore protease YyaC [Paenibacillus agricola]